MIPHEWDHLSLVCLLLQYLDTILRLRDRESRDPFLVILLNGIAGECGPDLVYTTFLEGDFANCVAQYVDMIKAQRGYTRYYRCWHDIRAIVETAYSDFKDCGIDLRMTSCQASRQNDDTRTFKSRNA